MDLWGKGGPTIFEESGEKESKKAREQDRKERVTPSPRMTAVLEVNAGDAALRGSVFRHVQCLKTSTSASLMCSFYRFACTAVPGMTWVQLWVSA